VGTPPFRQNSRGNPDPLSTKIDKCFRNRVKNCPKFDYKKVKRLVKAALNCPQWVQLRVFEKLGALVILYLKNVFKIDLFTQRYRLFS
jgi:hypothetical protein